MRRMHTFTSKVSLIRWAENLYHLKERTKIELFLPLVDSLFFQNLCQFIKMSQTLGYFVSLAWIINAHLSFSIREGHLKDKVMLEKFIDISI